MGFLQKLTAAGTRVVPMRASRSVRRIDRAVDAPLPASVPRGDDAPRRSEARDAVSETAAPRPSVPPAPMPVPQPTDAARPAAHAGEQAPGTHVRAIVEPEAAPARGPTPVVVPPPPAPVTIDLPAIEPEASLDVAAPPPFRRLPALSSDALDDRARPIVPDRVPPPRPLNAPPRVPSAAAAAPPRRVEPRRMSIAASERPMPLPALDPPAIGVPRATAQPPAVRSAVEADNEPHPARQPHIAQDVPARPQLPRAAVVEAVPESPRVDAARQTRPPAGLTIHKLELQVVERPRDVVPPPPAVADAAPAPPPSEWPDRRHHGFVW